MAGKRTIQEKVERIIGDDKILPDLTGAKIVSENGNELTSVDEFGNTCTFGTISSNEKE